MINIEQIVVDIQNDKDRIEKIKEVLQFCKTSFFTTCNKSSKTWQLLFLGFFIRTS